MAAGDVVGLTTPARASVAFMLAQPDNGRALLSPPQATGREPAGVGRTDQPSRSSCGGAVGGALASYQGTLLLVTHARRLLAAVDVTRTPSVAHGQVVDTAATGSPQRIASHNAATLE